MCEERVADSLMERMCHVCYRKGEFDKMPAEQQKQRLLEVVPERYLKAEMGKLRVPLRDAFMSTEHTGIVLWGEPGRGKTYAMAVLAMRYVTEGFIVQRIHYEELCLKLRDTFNPKTTQTEWSLIEPLLNCDKLFIEDVGTTKSIGKQESDFSLRTFLLLLDMRLERMRPTFITSNKSVESLGESFDQRVSDRLGMFKVFKMSGDSLR